MQRIQRVFRSSKQIFVPRTTIRKFNVLNTITPRVGVVYNNKYVLNCNHYRKLNDSSTNEEQLVDPVVFEQVCEDTLESLSDYFEELLEHTETLSATDVSYSSGVLTVALGQPYGTYVINRQSPNRQIWLSSPTSGPKRYDFVVSGNYWLYKHDTQSLHALLQKEISAIITDCRVDFSQCSYSKM